MSFANKAIWQTIFIENNKFFKYNIIIEKHSAHEYDIPEREKIIEVNSLDTGTSVSFFDLIKIDGIHLNSLEFNNYLIQEFAWYLHLNKQRNYGIIINGKELEYKKLITNTEETIISIEDQDSEFIFKILFIKWNEMIHEKSNFYFLDSKKKEIGKQPTSFNNKTKDFYHSVYIESNFFNDFKLIDEAELSLPMYDQSKNQNHKTFKAFLKEVKKFIELKEKQFIKMFGAEQLIQNFITSNLLPEFKTNKYDQERRKDLITVVKELYCIQPKIFQGLKPTQTKTCIGFLNIILDTDEREKIIEIMGSIIELSNDERQDLINVLKKTSLHKIIRTIKLIEDRYKAIEILKTLVFDLKKFTTERDHIQLVIESNYWLFGEEYHLVSADINFELMLSEYLYFLEDTNDILPGKKKLKIKLTQEEAKRRPDIFICRKRDIPDYQFSNGQLEENILVELKRPTVSIGKKEIRQIEDYLEFIVKEEKFNSQTRQWKFIVISNKVDDYVFKQYEENRSKGKRFLVKAWGNLEVFAMTWDDVFQSFLIRHKHLINSLQYDKSILIEELILRGIDINTEASDNLIKKIA